MRSNDTNDQLVRGSAADTVLVDDTDAGANADAIEQDTEEIAQPDAEATVGQPAQPDAEPPPDGSGLRRVGGGLPREPVAKGWLTTTPC